MSAKKARLNVALVGYGRMGKEIEAILVERGHKVVARFDPSGGEGVETEVKASLLSGMDGVIEFSLPGAVRSNAKIYGQAKINAVIGTTGWDADRDEVKKIVESAGIGYVYGSNYSIGAHLFFRLVADAARLINGVDEYDMMIHEFHHKGKADSPSGTALTAAAHVLANLDRKTVIQTESLDRPIRPEELHVSSTRGGAIPGVHTAMLDSLADSIEITHTARSRRGFALGSVLALEWLLGKRGFHNVEDWINDVLK